MNELAQLRQLPLRGYSRKPREHIVMLGQGEVGIRRWDSMDRGDMRTLFGIMHRRKVKENIDFEGVTAQGFAREFRKKKRVNSFNFAVTHGLKRQSDKPGESDAFVYFHFDKEDQKEYGRYVKAGIMPPLSDKTNIYEVGYAKSKTAPEHFTSRGLMEACVVMENLLREGYNPYHVLDPATQPEFTREELKDLSPTQMVELFKSREPDKYPKYTADEIAKLSPAERILLDSPLDMVIYAWVGETKRHVQDLRTGKTKIVFEINQESVNLANNSGFTEVGTVPDDEMPGANLHVYLLDWRKLQQVMHDRADEYILEATGKST